LRWIWSDWALAAFGGLALVAVSPLGQVVIIVALISIVGIPIAILVMALPSLFLLASSLRLAWGSWSSFRKGRTRAGLAFALALLAMADFFVFRAWRVNAWLDGGAAALAAQDTDAISPVGHQGTLAVLRASRGTWDGDGQCDDLCRRLLLTGAVGQVIAVPVASPQKRENGSAARSPKLEPSADMTGWSWRLEKRDHCDDPGPLTANRPVSLPEPAGERRGIAQPISSEQLLRLAIAGGTCLVGEKASLAQADAVLAYGEVKSAESTFSAGYNAWTDTVAAWRIAYWDRSADGFSLRYQRTGIVWQRLPGAFIPWIENGAELRTAHGWARVTEYLNRTPAEYEVPLGRFVTERLGLDLRPSPPAAVGEGQSPQAALRMEQARVVDRILASTSAPTDLEAKVIDDYIDSIGSPFTRRSNGTDRTDAGRVLRIVDNVRIPLPTRTSGAVGFAAEIDPSLTAALATGLAARLKRLPSPPTENRARKAWNGEVRAITGSLATLPPTALQPYTDLATDLMRNREQRAVSATFLARLDVFGPAIAPDIFAMMDDAFALRAPADREHDSLRYSWDDVWRAGALSLCKLAPQIPGEVGAMRQRVQVLAAAKITMADLVSAAALLGMGASVEDVREAMNVDPNNPAAAKSFAALIRRAKRDDTCR
jgi:hypothetical protein